MCVWSLFGYLLGLHTIMSIDIKPYHNVLWRDYREEILFIDGYKCVQCGKTKSDGVVLQIHHKEYIPGRKPWEYPFKLCETLCKGCHAAEHGHIMPKYGWEYLGYRDLGDLTGECEKCETDIRYAYLVWHKNWGCMEVGVLCCDDMTGTKEASEDKKKEERKKRFIESSRWKNKGSVFLIKQDKIPVKIYGVKDGWKIQMSTINGNHIYKDIDSAKGAAFDFIASGKAREFLKKKLPAFQYEAIFDIKRRLL